ncbi:MAG: alpha/beta fold hydrolase [Deltaproteobacteria bacterium]|nr:alpha/beta fold hydrolase [Deltaproteobacteria bacterium]
MKKKVLAVIIGFVFIASFFGCLAQTRKSLTLEIPNGPKVSALYYASQTNERRPAILILPGISGLRTSWKERYDEFSRWLNNEYNFNVLVIDYRARSEREMMQIARERKSMIFVEGEIKTALNFLRDQPIVDQDRIGLIGFSYGTLLSMMTAANDDSIKALVLVSLILPPQDKWSAPDPDLEKVLSNYANRPVLFIAAEKDYVHQNRSNVAQNSLYWSKRGKGDIEVKITRGGAHSMELLQVMGIQKKIGDWLQEKLI